MNEHYRMALPENVEIGDITIRDGLQVLEHYFPLEKKLILAEELILAGFKRIEVTNFGNPKFMPQFQDAEELLERIFQSENVGSKLRQNGGDVFITVVTINEKAVIRALDFKAKHGYGPDIILQMVSTDPAHHKVNSGMNLEDYWKMTERCTKMAKEHGIDMCGTVSTIWGSPIEGHRVTDLTRAVEFSKIYLDLGAAYIEQADHDGSSDPARVYEYFKMILDPALMGKWADPKYHLAHFHTSRGMGLANYLAALQAGIYRFETTLSGTGGQPANMVDGTLTGGTGKYYHKEHLLSGIVGTEDTVVMMESMGIKTGIDVPKLLKVGKMFKEEFLRISPADMDQMVKNVSEITGINQQRLYGLKGTEAPIGNLVEEATTFIEQPEDEKEKVRRDTIAQLLHSLRGYLTSGMWGLSRAETLISNVPPSPYLKHLL
ncbi:MAG: pyruvate carboxyltransferase [Pseudomonadota bacterium]